ncbi:uncharacterized protein LOC123377056 isoform X3 [Mauremys mutica]|uniref:uncharacterized protein LOC123377056 isoform X3 n=1 Tax=Mauremys mutica TaxID=74926 RepID=UPI001D16873D|nr:uncharacterized protein LOC123377056 isoform X3 [Mauremys mutica]
MQCNISYIPPTYIICPIYMRTAPITHKTSTHITHTHTKMFQVKVKHVLKCLADMGASEHKPKVTPQNGWQRCQAVISPGALLCWRVQRDGYCSSEMKEESLSDLLTSGKHLVSVDLGDCEAQGRSSGAEKVSRRKGPETDGWTKPEATNISGNSESHDGTEEPDVEF